MPEPVLALLLKKRLNRMVASLEPVSTIAPPKPLGAELPVNVLFEIVKALGVCVVVTVTRIAPPAATVEAAELFVNVELVMLTPPWPAAPALLSKL